MAYPIIVNSTALKKMPHQAIRFVSALAPGPMHLFALVMLPRTSIR
jgi:hypothetical protein